jgi:hypothetical protein
VGRRCFFPPGDLDASLEALPVCYMDDGAVLLSADNPLALFEKLRGVVAILA